jgi:periplasmic divalent cation tolerance protein
MGKYVRIKIMKMFYITLNTQEEAKAISHALLEKRLAVCINWFPIQCAYLWEGKIKEDAEVVLIVKTREGMREAIEKVVYQHISCTNYMAEIDVFSINEGVLKWLDAEVPKI